MRISRHSMFMQMAEAASRRSTCYRRSVGAVLTVNNNVLSIGYNGPPSGEPHCTGSNCPASVGCTRAVHAEVNAINRLQLLFPAKLIEDPWNLYVTESPCESCARELVDFGIERVFYFHEYRMTEGLQYLVSNEVQVYRMTPGGFIIDYKTNELVNV